MPAGSPIYKNLLPVPCNFVLWYCGGEVRIEYSLDKGGAEFRLPVLGGVFGYPARRAVALNLAISLITVVSALLIRGGTLSFAPLLGLLPVVVGMIAGAVSAAYFGTALVHRVSERLLERVILVFLVVIGAALIVEAFLPQDVPGLLPDALPV